MIGVELASMLLLAGLVGAYHLGVVRRQERRVDMLGYPSEMGCSSQGSCSPWD